VTDLNPEQVRRLRAHYAGGTAATALDFDVVDVCDSWLAQREALAAAQQALGEIRWLHHDDAKTYQQLFVEAARIAERALAPFSKEDAQRLADHADSLKDSRQ
jgi:hypothetical protein